MKDMNGRMDRRGFLRGLGVTLALPWLDSLGPARAARVEPPRRVVFLYTPNGYNQATFLPAETGTDWTLPPALEPLAPVRGDVTLVTGLDRRFVGGTGVHAQCGSCWLTSSPPDETLDGGFPTNVTLDRKLAGILGRDTAFPSLELSCNDFPDNKETKYFECISWYGPGYAAKTEKNPRAVFRRLFGQAPGDPATRSVLDVVLDEARAMRRRLDAADRGKLDEYLDSVRETERRIQIAETAASGEPVPMAEPAGIPERRDDYLALMGELIVHAFRLDLTRVATLVVDPERWDSPRMFHGVFDSPQNHHVLTHTKGEDARAKITAIDRFHVARYAALVERMRSVPEGDGTLLDHAAVVMGSGISDGDRHDYGDLQVLIAGRAGGRLTPGAHRHYEGDRPLADLWLTLLNRMGGTDERFADSTGVLTDL